MAELGKLFSTILAFGENGNWKMFVMWIIGALLIYLAIKKQMEPTLLLPIGFGAILANLPPVIDAATGAAVASALGEHGFLPVLFNAGIGCNFRLSRRNNMYIMLTYGLTPNVSLFHREYPEGMETLKGTIYNARTISRYADNSIGIKVGFSL